MMTKEREYWLDIVKLYACILVALGHFLQSMIAADILQETYFTLWFNQTIYYFHVPLFFICSGYIHQKYASKRSVVWWKNNFCKKILTLGIPYLAFSILTWILKNLFSGAVNSGTDGLLKTLFQHPLSPYWYLYTLVIIFLITIPVLSRKEYAALLCIALVMKCLSFFPFTDIYALKILFQNEIWFVLGMGVRFFSLTEKFDKCKPLFPFAIGMLFIILSLILASFDVYFELISFSVGIIACFSTVAFAIKLEHFRKLQVMVSKTSIYTFPIFLMHTIFAAGIRAILLKCGVNNSPLHIILGITFSFFGPIVAANILSRIKWADFILYPGKYIKVR